MLWHGVNTFMVSNTSVRSLDNTPSMAILSYSHTICVSKSNGLFKYVIVSGKKEQNASSNEHISTVELILPFIIPSAICFIMIV